MIVVPRTEHGARGLYQCKDGYVLKVVLIIITCSFGLYDIYYDYYMIIYASGD